VRTVEDALGIKIPKNAHLLRALFDKTLQVHDQVVHFSALFDKTLQVHDQVVHF
jgi:Ni,Fe-hydrogenase I large subunit